MEGNAWGQTVRRNLVSWRVAQVCQTFVSLLEFGPTSFPGKLLSAAKSPGNEVELSLWAEAYSWLQNSLVHRTRIRNFLLIVLPLVSRLRLKRRDALKLFYFSSWKLVKSFHFSETGSHFHQQLFGQLTRFLKNRKSFGPGAIFSKIPKPFGPFSGIFMSTNSTTILPFVILKTRSKTSLLKQAEGNCFVNGFWVPKSYLDFRETGLWREGLLI